MRSPLHRNTLIAAIYCLAAACSPRTTPDDTVVMVVEAPMTSADPRYAISNNDSKLARLVYAGLTAVDTPTVEPRLDLAERIDYDGGLVATVVLKPGLKFSDGAPLTANDVARTFDSVMAKGSTSLSHKGFNERFVRLVVVDERTIRFELKKPLATIMSDLDFGILASNNKGAGPYALHEITSTHVLLDRNDHYHGERAQLPHVEIKFVRDAGARLLMMAGGSADLIQNNVRLDLLAQLEGREGIKVESAPSVILTYLMMNNADPVLSDVRVRQAIALAIDRPALIAAKFGGRARLATGLLPETHWAYNGDVARYPHDVERAKALLDAAGLTDPDGPGPRPRVTLTYKTSSDAWRVAVARIIAAQLANVGIAIELRSFEFATFFVDIKKGIYQLASMQTAEITEPDYYRTYFHSSEIPNAQRPDTGNRWRYANADVDRLTDLGRTTPDRAARARYYGEVQAILAAELPIVPLWHEDNVAVTRSDVVGYRLTPNARLTGLVSAQKAR